MITTWCNQAKLVWSQAYNIFSSLHRCFQHRGRGGTPMNGLYRYVPPLRPLSMAFLANPQEPLFRFFFIYLWPILPEITIFLKSQFFWKFAFQSLKIREIQFWSLKFGQIAVSRASILTKNHVFWDPNFDGSLFSKPLFSALRVAHTY